VVYRFERRRLTLTFHAEGAMLAHAIIVISISSSVLAACVDSDRFRSDIDAPAAIVQPA
jgi:hypothetical protein